MRRSIPKPQFDKDIRRLKRRGKNIEKLIQIIALLEKGTSLPSALRQHKLSGIYEGVLECHIEPDWLLIYTITSDMVTLYRTGSHTDLF